jgi:hypothetical protein
MCAGCSGTQKVVVQAPEPSCESALAGKLQDYSDSELAALLDQALAEERIEKCWTPLMEIALKKQRGIPQRHLAHAVHAFNKRSHQDQFHLAVSRYLTFIARGKASYRESDRRLLEAYCRFLIHHSSSRSDRRLTQAMLLCSRLDPDLYRKYFN